MATNIGDLLEATYDEERTELIRLGRALLDGRPGLIHRRRVQEIRIDRDALLAAQRITNGRRLLR